MEQYEAWKVLLRSGEATAWQEFYVKFYQAFIDGSRWKQYLSGVGTTLMVTAMALAMDNDMPMVCFGLDEENSIIRVVKGEEIGTTVKNHF